MLLFHEITFMQILYPKLPVRLELTTSCLRSKRSNQMSYESIFFYKGTFLKSIIFYINTMESTVRGWDWGWEWVRVVPRVSLQALHW